jgi:peroxiredoxin
MRRLFIFLISILIGSAGYSQDGFVDVGDVAPDFTLVTTEGDTLSLSDFRGKVVLLNFFGYDCSGCIVDGPYVQITWLNYQNQDVVVLGINTKNSGESVSIIRNLFAIPTGATYPLLMSGESVAANYGVSFEFYFVINQAGIVKLRSYGFDSPAVHSAIDQALFITSVEEDDSERPAKVSVEQNYPNPFNRNTTINFQIPEPDFVRLTIHNIRGQLVQELMNKSLDAGKYHVQWDGTEATGANVPSGIYYYHLNTGSNQQIRKMTYIK